jgi:hypothetical protein
MTSHSAIVTHAVEIRAFGQNFAAANGDTLEVVGGILHINGRSVKEMAEDRGGRSEDAK